MEFSSCHYHVLLPSFVCWSYSSSICKDEETIMKTHAKRTKAPHLYCHWKETNHYNGNNGIVYFLLLFSFSLSTFFIIKVEPSFSCVVFVILLFTPPHSKYLGPIGVQILMTKPHNHTTQCLQAKLEPIAIVTTTLVHKTQASWVAQNSRSHF